MATLEERLKQQAHLLGFEMTGIAPATEADGFDHLKEWLARGYAGSMDYMHRHGEARRSPTSILPQVRSIIMAAMSYRPDESDNQKRSSPAVSWGRISCYARGRDYHDILRDRLRLLLDWLRQEIPDCIGRAVVDTAPLLERDFARRAGLGWFGKNTMLINKRYGSYFFIGALLTNIQLTFDEPHETAHCGSCTACLDACPTQAFVAPGILDARRCISYLTIEKRDAIPLDLRPGLGDWVFGCDICQDVCPWNRKAPLGSEPEFQGFTHVDARELLSLSEEEFRRRFRGTPLLRTKRSGLLRNAALVLGNVGDASALPALRKAVDDSEPLIREAAQWAIEQILSRT
jgi:epoxyqueuosine reductase